MGSYEPLSFDFWSVKPAAIAPKKAPVGAEGCLQTKGALKETAAEQAECPQALGDNALKHFERVFDDEANLIQIRFEIGCTGSRLANTEGHVFH